MAIIHIDNIHCKAIIGTQAWERATKQELILSLTVEYDSANARKTDDLYDALDYAKLAEETIQKAENSRFFLLEKLGDDLLRFVLKQNAVKSASITLTKPAALGKNGTVTVEISGQNN